MCVLAKVIFTVFFGGWEKWASEHPVSSKLVIESPTPDSQLLQAFDLSCAPVLNGFLQITANMQRPAAPLSEEGSQAPLTSCCLRILKHCHSEEQVETNRTLEMLVFPFFVFWFTLTSKAERHLLFWFHENSWLTVYSPFGEVSERLIPGFWHLLTKLN